MLATLATHPSVFGIRPASACAGSSVGQVLGLGSVSGVQEVVAILLEELVLSSFSELGTKTSCSP